MQEAHELRQIRNVVMLASCQRMIKRNVYNSVAVLHIKNNRIPALLTPAADDAQAVIAAGHHPGQVNSANFEIPGNGYAFFNDRRIENTGDDQSLSGFKEVARAIVVGLADSVGDFAGSQVPGFFEELAGNSG